MANQNQLTNPDINPKLLVFTGTSATDKTSFYFADACGIAAQTGLIDTTNGVAFGVANGFTVTNVKDFLKSYALIVSEYRLDAEDSSDLVNNLTAIYCCIDGNSSKRVLFSADSVTPFANNPNLLLIKKPFVLTSTTALKISTAAGAGHNMTLTLTIGTMVPYGMLDQYLQANPIYI